MARPTFNAPKAGATGNVQSKNFISGWRERRREHRREAEEKASQLITNKIAENENIIIDKLSSVDYIRSGIPKPILEHKTNPNQPYGDLEYAAQGIIQMLRRNPQTIKMDIRQFDEKLLALVLLFKQTVEHGDVRAAYAAKGAIVRAVADIRSRIPQEQPELSTIFVEANTKYLDQWITLVTMAQVADRTKQNLESQIDRLNKAKAELDAQNEALEKYVREDDERTVAFFQLTNRAGGQDRSTWGELEKDLHMKLVDRRMANVQHHLNETKVHQMKMELAARENQVEMLYTKVASLPIVTDPDLMNKYQESIDELFRDMAASDVQIDETLKALDDVEGRLQQIEKGPGNQRWKEVAVEEAEQFLEEMKKKQQIQSGEDSLRAKKMREAMGIRSEEELAEMKRQAELELQRAAEQVREQFVEQEQQLLMN